ncbi:hypothetical protein CFP56_009217 [Quercus suber]|uniref:Reverse transcriptase zinc-binding domain-containing protein n=1 Tax=Quercus suber TaxID=58331 RepID=A0AAW0L276_QUESU
MSYFRLCMHNSAPVREVLAGRGINCNPLYPICKNQGESIDHLLKECLFSYQFWLKIWSPHIIPPLHNQSLGDWLYENCHSKRIHHSNISWSVFFFLLFGIYGSIVIEWFLIMLHSTLTFMGIV